MPSHKKKRFLGKHEHDNKFKQFSQADAVRAAMEERDRKAMEPRVQPIPRVMESRRVVNYGFERGPDFIDGRYVPIYGVSYSESGRRF